VAHRRTTATEVIRNLTSADAPRSLLLAEEVAAATRSRVTPRHPRPPAAMAAEAGQAEAGERHGVAVQVAHAAVEAVVRMAAALRMAVINHGI